MMVVDASQFPVDCMCVHICAVICYSLQQIVAIVISLSSKIKSNYIHMKIAGREHVLK